VICEQVFIEVSLLPFILVIGHIQNKFIGKINHVAGES